MREIGTNELVLLLLALGALSLTIALATHVAVAVVRRRRPSGARCPGISVLKPVKGAEPGLYENLAALARQDYPEFEILIGAEDPSDAALDVAKQLRRDFPHVKIRVLSNVRPIGFNPKVSNLYMLSRHAAHDWVLVSDASVRPGPGYLRAMAAELAAPGVELVSSLLVGFGGSGPGARLDNLLMNTLVVRAIAGAQLLSHPCVVGKSMLFRLSRLAELGGFRAVGDVLAEDYVLGRLFHEAGHRVALSAYPLRTASSQRSVLEFCQRHLRWAQMRRHLAPVYFGEPLLATVPWFGGALLLGALDPSGLAHPDLLVLCGLGVLCRLSSDALLLRSLLGRFPSPEDLAGLVVKDALLLGVWAVAIVRKRVSWRGNEFYIGSGSRLHPARRVAAALPEGA